ncbi:hypothetical protein J7L68_06515 [bacterium]|nr:hypothetical protein [bacterium]
MNEFDEKKFDEIWESTMSVLTPREMEKIRGGIWHKVEKHRKALKFRAVFVTTAIIIIAVIIAIDPFSSGNNIDQNDFFVFSEKDYWQQLEKIPEDEIIYEVIDTDIDSIANVMIYESDIESAISTLSNDEQEELLVALADEI